MRSAPVLTRPSSASMGLAGVGLLCLAACDLFLPEDDAGDSEGAAAPVFVAVGDEGAVLSSPDGATWSVRTSGTTLALNDVTYGGERYVAVGQAGKIVVSTDGLCLLYTSPSPRD